MSHVTRRSRVSSVLVAIVLTALSASDALAVYQPKPLQAAAISAPVAPVRQQLEMVEGFFFSREDDGTGCLVDRGASLGLIDYVVSSASATLVTRRAINGTVSQYNYCTDTFSHQAGGEFTLDEFTLDSDLGSARLRAHAMLVEVQSGNSVAAVLDLTFVPTGTPRASFTYNPSRVECVTASGAVIPCVRTHHFRDGFFVGTFIVDGADWVVPPGDPINGTPTASATASRLLTTCVLPVGADPGECQLIQLP